MPAISRGKVRVEVALHPFSLTIHRGSKALIRRLSSEFDFQYKGRYYSFSPRVEEEQGSRLVLRDRNVDVVLELSLRDDALKLSWRAGGELDSVVDAWSAYGGEWYGQGQLRFQIFPLSRHFTAMTPFLARNTQVPLWINRLGVAILVDTYKLFETYFAGSLVIRGLQADEFTYHVLVGENIADVYRKFARRVGPPERVPDRMVLAKPIFSTWAHFKKDIDEEKVREYAREIREHEFPCSIVEIDDKWERNYGDFTFDSEKFPNPRKLVEEIHEMGYLATLWVYPFINYESENYEYARKRGYLVLDPEEDEPAKIRWWNGEGGLLDISNPEARAWYNGLLNRLKSEYGFDGFKFDAGDASFFPMKRVNGRIKLGRTYGRLTPNQYTDEWLRFIAENHYALAEVRVGFLGQRYGIIAREGDKESTWGLDNGLYAAITQALTLSLTGYPYIMPDMIGGNEYMFKCDKELFIRWVEATALMPIVQYSIPPWRFDDETVEISKFYTNLHLELADYYVELAERASREGEPILSPLVLRYPDDDEAAVVSDEYLVGDLLVAPVVEKGRTEREVYLPEGTWIDLWSGEEHRGPARISVDAPLEKLPLFANALNPRLRKLRLKM